MPERGMQVDPIVEDTPDGPKYVGVEIAGENTARDRNGNYRGWEDDWTADSQGRSIYTPRVDDEIEGENTTVGFDFTDYGETFKESVGAGQYDAIVDYGFTYLDKSLYDKFEAAIDAGNITQFHELFELFQQAYLQSDEAVQQAEEEPQEELEEVSDRDFAEAVETLNQTEAAGTEVAYQWLQAAEQSNDAVYQSVAMMTARFHRGEVSSQEAVNELMAKYTLRQLSKVYKQIMQ